MDNGVRYLNMPRSNICSKSISAVIPRVGMLLHPTPQEGSSLDSAAAWEVLVDRLLNNVIGPEDSL